MNARILVVDDSGFARRTLRQMLEAGGFSVEEAGDGPTALELYFLNKADLVMLDMVMEGMTGLEVLCKLRELDPQAKVVIATADVQTSTRVEAEAAGASGFIIKPFDRVRVIEAVTNVLAGGKSWN